MATFSSTETQEIDNLGTYHYSVVMGVFKLCHWKELIHSFCICNKDSWMNVNMHFMSLQYVL